MNSVEFRQICQVIKALEVSLNGKIDGFSRQFMGALKGIGILDPDKDTMTTAQVCAQYGISARQLYKYRENGDIPYIKSGTSKNAKVMYRIADIVEFFSVRNG